MRQIKKLSVPIAFRIQEESSQEKRIKLFFAKKTPGFQ
jgi:hypothetical protein